MGGKDRGGRLEIDGLVGQLMKLHLFLLLFQLLSAFFALSSDYISLFQLIIVFFFFLFAFVHSGQLPSLLKLLNY